MLSRCSFDDVADEVVPDSITSAMTFEVLDYNSRGEEGRAGTFSEDQST